MRNSVGFTGLLQSPTFGNRSVGFCVQCLGPNRGTVGGVFDILYIDSDTCTELAHAWSPPGGLAHSHGNILLLVSSCSLYWCGLTHLSDMFRKRQIIQRWDHIHRIWMGRGTKLTGRHPRGLKRPNENSRCRCSKVITSMFSRIYS
jgi:hypothetical protein